MEIKFHNVLLNNKEINIELNSDDIIGVVTNDKKSFLDLISLENISSGEIFFNDKKITKDNAYQYQRIISIVHSYYHFFLAENTALSLSGAAFSVVMSSYTPMSSKPVSESSEAIKSRS